MPGELEHLDAVVASSRKVDYIPLPIKKRPLWGAVVRKLSEVFNAARHAQHMVLSSPLNYSDKGLGDALWNDVRAGRNTTESKSRMHEESDAWRIRFAEAMNSRSSL